VGAANREQDGFTSYEHPHALLVQPIFTQLHHVEESPIGGYLTALFTWDAYLVNLLPETVSDILVVIENTCNQKYSYRLDGSTVSLG